MWFLQNFEHCIIEELELGQIEHENIYKLKQCLQTKIKSGYHTSWTLFLNILGLNELNQKIVQIKMWIASKRKYITTQLHDLRDSLCNFEHCIVEFDEELGEIEPQSICKLKQCLQVNTNRYKQKRKICWRYAYIISTWIFSTILVQNWACENISANMSISGDSTLDLAWKIKR